MDEVFSPVSGYEGLYAVSNMGRIYSIRKNKMLCPKQNGRGYLQVELTKCGRHKMHYVHRLVAKAFIPNPENFEQVNHKDEDVGNNMAENLEWCTPNYNLSYGTRTKRIAAKQKKPVTQFSMGGEKIRTFDGLSDVERLLGFNHANISNCCNGKLSSAYGFRWKYA